MPFIGNKPSAVPLTAADITDSIITSAKIVDGTIVNADINASAAIASSKLSGSLGKVLQVIQGTSSTSTSNNTTTYADSSLSASITPSSTSNKILVLITQKFFLATGTSDRGSIKIKLLRGSTNIWEDTEFYLQTTGISGEIDRFVSMNYLDSPSTTSSTTYKTQFAINSTATNKIAYAQYGSMPSYLTLIEIAA
jgi:hypothetical protein